MKSDLKKALMEALMGSEEKGESMGEPGGLKHRAKMDVLKELRDMMAEKAGSDVAGGLRSVKVAAPDKEGLVKGLDMAEKLVQKPEMMEAPELSEEDSLMDEEEKLLLDAALEGKEEEDEEEEA